MKKILLVFSAAIFMQTANAQLNLSGTSYTQNFNSLAPATGLPVGWMVAVDATTTAPGQNVVSTRYNAAHPTWRTFTNGFKNLASGNGYTMANYFAFYSDSLAQANAADRALAVRQTSTVGDSGAAFILQIANTTNLSAFNLSFKLQSLDTSCPRTTTWRVDYATGATPALFTELPVTGTMTTGNKTFSNNTITASFGNALDNKAGPVWIRIVTVKKTTGAGNRPTTAIDDFNLTWTGVATGVEDIKRNSISKLQVLGAATRNNATIGYNALPGEYTVNIYDMSGRIVHTEKLSTGGGLQMHSLNGFDLTAGMYLLEMNGRGHRTISKLMVQ